MDARLTGLQGTGGTSAKTGRSWLDTSFMIFLSSAGLVLLCLAATSGWLRILFGTHHPDSEGFVRGACLMAALAAGVIADRLRRAWLLAETKTDDEVRQPEVNRLIELQHSVSDDNLQYDYGSVTTFIELIVNAGPHRSRVVETVDFEGRAITQHVSIEFTLPGSASAETLYVPVLQPIKGELVDRFSLTDSSGGGLADLSYEETMRLAAVGLRVLLLDATGVFKFEGGEKETELVLLGILSRRGMSTPDSAKKKIDAALSALKMIDRDDDERVDRLKRYLLSLSLSYPIVAVVPFALVTANRLLLRYERCIIPASQHKGLRGEVRLGLGIRPNEVALSPVLALTASSYHLLVNCPSDKYVLKQALRCKHCESLVNRQWRGKSPNARDDEKVRDPKVKCCHTTQFADGDDSCHYRLRRRRGQSYVHLYMRGYAHAEPMYGLQLFVQLKEVPPGSRGQAVVTAVATTVLIGTVGHLMSHETAVSTSDLPALALSLPAVAASWFGFAADGSELTGSSLLARLSLISSGALSVAAIVIYLARLGGIVTGPGKSGAVIQPAASIGHHGIHVAFLGVTDVPWLVLLALSSVNLAYIAWRFALKVSVYSAMLSKPDTSELEYSHG
jgi:hypothetical protein